jgi:hypothetical protein
MTRKKKDEKRVDWYPVCWQDNKGNLFNEQFSDIRHGVEFDSLRGDMDRIQTEYGTQFEKFRVERMTKYGYGDDQWDEYHVQGWREETDEEFTSRVGEVAAREAQQEARERAEFERLKQKFGTES